MVAVVRSFRDQRIPGMIIGGVAASLLGRPRTTKDVDAVVWLERREAWIAYVERASRYGLVPRIDDAIAFAERSRVLLLRHEPSGIDVDVSLGALPFEEEAIGRAELVTLGRRKIPLPTPEDLIVMKAIAHRPRDAADIEGVLDAQPSVDVARIRRWVDEFATMLEAPELLRDLDDLLGRVGRGPSTRRSKTKRAR